MTEQELNQSIKDLARSFEAGKRLLIRQYCDANNKYKIGDVFTDHIGAIAIEIIDYYYSNPPCCAYFGLELKKDGTPKKNREKRTAYQSNDINKKKEINSHSKI